MSERDPLWAAIVANPEDDGPRLVAADQLAERGDVRGEFTVLQCLVASGKATEEQRERAMDLLWAFRPRWDDELLDGLRGRPALEYRRGFAEKAAFLAQMPTLRELDLLAQRVPLLDLSLPMGFEGVDCDLPGWSGLRELRALDTQVPAVPEFLPRLLEGLGRPRSLELSFQGPVSKASAELIARSRIAPGLEHLSVHGPFEPGAFKALLGEGGWDRLVSLSLSRWTWPGPRPGGADLAELAGSTLAQRLERLSLSSVSATWLLGAIEAGLRFSRLRRLSLYTAGLGFAGVDALLAATHAFPALEELHVGRDLQLAISADWGEAPASLKRLAFDDCQMSADRIKGLMRAPWAAQLESLALAGCWLDRDCLLAFEPSRLPRLESLDLSRNRLPAKALERLVERKEWGPLRELRLAGCELTADALRLLAQAARWPSLSTMVLNRNSLGDAGVQALAGAEGLTALRRIELSSTEVGERGIAALLASKLPLRGLRLWIPIADAVLRRLVDASHGVRLEVALRRGTLEARQLQEAVESRARAGW